MVSTQHLPALAWLATTATRLDHIDHEAAQVLRDELAAELADLVERPVLQLVAMPLD